MKNFKIEKFLSSPFCEFTLMCVLDVKIILSRYISKFSTKDGSELSNGALWTTSRHSHPAITGWICTSTRCWWKIFVHIGNSVHLPWIIASKFLKKTFFELFIRSTFMFLRSEMKLNAEEWQKINKWNLCLPFFLFLIFNVCLSYFGRWWWAKYLWKFTDYEMVIDDFKNLFFRVYHTFFWLNLSRPYSHKEIIELNFNFFYC